MTTTITQLPLSEYGVVTAGPGTDKTRLWAAGFSGCERGNAITVHFTDEPEHRAIEALCERFGATACKVTPPVKRDECPPMGALNCDRRARRQS